MAWKIVDPIAGSQPIATVDTVQRHPLGTKVRAVDPTYGAGEFLYVKGVSGGVAKAWVHYDSDAWTTSLVVANSIGPIGIMMSLLAATTDFGWIQISGKALGLVLTSYTDNGQVYSTSTSGTVDDTSVVGDLIMIAKGASAPLNTGSTPLYAEFEIFYPASNDKHANK